MPEVEIYHSYTPDYYQKKEKTKKNKLSKVFSKLAKIIGTIGVILLIISFAPSFWYAIRSGGIGKISKLISETISGKGEEVYSQPKNVLYQPRFDSKLPREARVKIAKAKIDTQIWEATFETYEDALRKGVWRVPDFGSPEDRTKPTILAAHRYGYLAWSIPYRLKNSFYSLPRLKKGDTVEIIWKQRKYTYEVYDESKGEEISDYSADLILYTCESLNSPERIFKYARLIQI